MFLGACGARCLILLVVFWNIANMQSAHACAVQTAFQAPPTLPKVSPKHTPGTQKHEQRCVSTLNAFSFFEYGPHPPVNLDSTRTGKDLLPRTNKRRQTREGNSKEEQSKSKARTSKSKQEQQRIGKSKQEQARKEPRANKRKQQYARASKGKKG